MCTVIAVVQFQIVVECAVDDEWPCTNFTGYEGEALIHKLIDLVGDELLVNDRDESIPDNVSKGVGYTSYNLRVVSQSIESHKGLGNLNLQMQVIEAQLNDTFNIIKSGIPFHLERQRFNRSESTSNIGKNRRVEDISVVPGEVEVQIVELEKGSVIRLDLDNWSVSVNFCLRDV